MSVLSSLAKDIRDKTLNTTWGNLSRDTIFTSIRNVLEYDIADLIEKDKIIVRRNGIYTLILTDDDEKPLTKNIKDRQVFVTINKNLNGNFTVYHSGRNLKCDNKIEYLDYINSLVLSDPEYEYFEYSDPFLWKDLLDVCEFVTNEENRK